MVIFKTESNTNQIERPNLIKYRILIERSLNAEELFLQLLLSDVLVAADIILALKVQTQHQKQISRFFAC